MFPWTAASLGRARARARRRRPHARTGDLHSPLLKRILLRAVAALASCVSVAAAEVPLHNVSARSVLSLNGRWNVIVDPYDNGYVDYRLVRWDSAEKPAGGYFLDRAPGDSDGAPIEYDFDRSPSLNVPGDWNSQSDQLLYYEGSVWYRRKFDYTPRPGMERQFLYFGAANYEADVYLNGKKLGRHVGGFGAFQFEVTGRLRPSGNSLVVRVNNQRHPEGVPTINTDWWNYGGLTRDVLLVETPRTFIRDYGLQLQRGTRDRVTGYVQLDGAAAGRPVQVAIGELGVQATAKADAQGRATFEFPITGATLWTPETPKLYAVALSSGGDTVCDRIGFRTIETRGTDILLNGKPVFLRGVSVHEEDPLRGGRACTEAEARMLLGWARDLGCNYVRLAHYPHDEYMTRVADELGLLVWAEVPVYWTIHWKDPDTYANAEAQLTEIINRDRNRASVVIWSMANETPVSPERTAFLSRLAAHARALDSTRLISAAMEVRADPTDPNTKIVEDPLAQVTDVVSFNEYIGWYVGRPEDCAKVRWVVPYQKPVLISEFGGDALQGMHGDVRTRFTEEFQAELYRQTLPMLEKIPQLRGMTPWILCDFRSPRRALPKIQDGWNRKGLIGQNGMRKEAFFVLQQYYRTKAAAAGTPGAQVSSR